MKKTSATNGIRAIAVTLTTAGTLLSFVPAATAQWSDRTNSGFVALDTLPAVSPAVGRPLGPLAPGTKPVIGSNGTVYIGNADGEMQAFHPGGMPLWSRRINNNQGGFFGPPVEGADGSIYAISTMRHEELNEKPNESFLHKFTPGGGWVYSQQLPASDLYPFLDRGATNAAPNIWQWNGTEVVMVPVKYQALGREEIQLLAFSTITGAVIARKQVSVKVAEISGGIELPGFFPSCLALNLASPGGEVLCAFIKLITSAGEFASPPYDIPLIGAGFPLAGVAMVPDSQGGPPRVAMTDREHTKVIFSFSPENGFTEIHRRTFPGKMFTTPPVVRPNGRITVGTLDGFLATTSTSLVESFTNTGVLTLTAAPTRHKDGGIVVVGRGGDVVKLGGGTSYRKTLEGASIASAAATCTYVYINTMDGLYTFNADTMQQVARVFWANHGGGLSTPVVGPFGHVYAIASNNLFVFEAPLFPTINGCRGPNQNPYAN